MPPRKPPPPDSPLRPAAYLALLLLLAAFSLFGGCAARQARAQAPAPSPAPSPTPIPPPPGALTDTWVGNSLADRGTGLRVPTMPDSLAVWPDGSVLLGSHYNEGGRAYTLLSPAGAALGCTDGLAVPGPDRADGVKRYYYVGPNEGLQWHATDGSSVTGDPASAWYQGAGNWTQPGDPAKLFPDQPGGAHYIRCQGISRGANVLWVSDGTDYAADPTGGQGSTTVGRLWLVDADTRKLIRWIAAPGAGGTVSCAPDGKSAWYVSGANAVRVDDSGATLATVTPPAGFSSLSALPDGGCLVTGPALGAVLRYDAAGKRLPDVALRPSYKPLTYTRDDHPGGWLGRLMGRWRTVTVTDASVCGGLEPGSVSVPVGAGVDAAGSLYVLCADAALPKLSRVDRYPSDGKGGWDLSRGARVCWGGTFGDLWATDPTDPELRWSSIGVMRGEGSSQTLIASTWDMAANPRDPRRWLGCQGGAGRSTLGVRVLGGHKFLFSTVGGADWDVYRLPGAGQGYVARCVAQFASRDPGIDRADYSNAPPDLPHTGYVWSAANGYTVRAYDDNGTGPDQGRVTRVTEDGAVWVGTTEFPATLGADGNPAYPVRGVQHPIPGADHYGALAMTGVTRDGSLWVLGKRDADASLSLAFWPGWRQMGCPDVPPAWVTADVADATRAHADWSRWDRSVGSIDAAGDYVFVCEGLGGAVKVYRRDTGALVGRMPPTPLATNSTQDDPQAFEAVKMADGTYRLTAMSYLTNCNAVRTWNPDAAQPHSPAPARGTRRPCPPPS